MTSIGILDRKVFSREDRPVRLRAKTDLNWDAIQSRLETLGVDKGEIPELVIDLPVEYEVDGGIKHRERVRTLAEVLTHEREVKAMLDLVGDPVREIKTRVLEPACGNGNFLVEILARKLATVQATTKRQEDFEFGVILSLASIYGIDIDSENVQEARERLRAVVVNFYSAHRNTWQPKDGFLRSVEYVLAQNIILGDTLNGAEQIEVVEYSSPAPALVTQRVFRFADLLADDTLWREEPQALRVIGAKHYLELPREP